MIETFRDHIDDVYQEQEASTETEKASQTENSVNTKSSFRDCQVINQAAPMADREIWNKTMNNHTVLHIDQKHLECTITGKKGPINNIYDNVDPNVEGMELSDSPRQQEKDENEEITDLIIEK